MCIQSCIVNSVSKLLVLPIVSIHQRGQEAGLLPVHHTVLKAGACSSLGLQY